jgi:hypothetical protein
MLLWQFYFLERLNVTQSKKIESFEIINYGIQKINIHLRPFAH